MTSPLKKLLTDCFKTFSGQPEDWTVSGPCHLYQGGQIQSSQEASLSWKRAKKEPKGQTKILGPASVIWDQIS